MVQPRDFSKIQALTQSSSLYAYKTTRRKQIKKFAQLCPKRPVRNRRSPISPFPLQQSQAQHLHSQKAFIDKTVVNLSQRQLTASETKVLSLGMNFAVPPKTIPVEEIIQSTEPALQHLNKAAAEEVRIQIHQAI